MKNADGFTSIHSSDAPDNRQPVRPDDLPKQPVHHGYDPKRDANPGLLAKLFKAVESKQDQAARLQREAEIEADRLAKLQSDLRNLEAARQSTEDNLGDLESEYQRLVTGRPNWLEACRANWRKRNYAGSMMAEVDFMIADYPAHRAMLVERLKAAQAAIVSFKLQHKI